jgi:hypothetical protein
MRCFTLRGTGVPLILLAAGASAYASPPADSAYATDPQSSHVEDATSQGIGQVNMITCFMSSIRPDALVNQGNYIALVDKNQCDPSSRSSASNAGASTDATQAANYMTATVNSTRASNSDPMIAKVWVHDSEQDHQAIIYAHVSASAAPTTDNPYGQFRLDFCGKAVGVTTGSCKMQGYLQGASGGLSFYQTDSNGQGGTETVALQLTAAGTTSGSGSMQMSDGTNTSQFDFAYNSTLFRRSDGTQDQCFSRDASDPATGFSVWSYGLYDATTGARVERNSGFPIEYTNGGTTYRGYLSYWGLSLPPDAMASLTSGSTVAKVDYSNNSATRTNYTVVESAGKLMKFTRQTTTLKAIDQIRFNTWVGSDANSFYAGATPNTQYEVYWDDSSGSFKADGMMSCGQNGCQTQTFDAGSVQTVPLSYWTSMGGVNGWSQSLGGNLFINLQGVSNPVDSTSVTVVYRTQDLVYPSDLPANLYCVNNCPTAATLTAYFAQSSTAQSPYTDATFNNWNPTAAGNVVTYTGDANAVVLRDSAAAAVTFSDASAYSSHPQYQWGVMSGRLFANLSDAECSPGSGTYCDYKVDELPVYYQWQTGPNSSNQFAAVKDVSGNFVQFDAPLQVTWQVPSDAAFGTYAGKSIVLQYGGFGQLWGIPGSCVSSVTNEPVSCNTQNARYVPSFAIPMGANTVTAGQTTYLVKWLDREIRFASKDISVCTGNGLTLPASVPLPTAAVLKDTTDPNSDVYIGTEPVVTDAPRVIQGQVEY